MGFFSKLRLLSKLSLGKFIYYNYFSGHVERIGKGYLLPYKNSVIEMADGARIIIGDGHLAVNPNRPSGSHAEAFIRMRENAVLRVHDSLSLAYKATIEIHKDAEVEVGSAFINSDAVVLAAKKIQIGHGCLISRMVFIFDADHHPIYNEAGEQINQPKPVIIGDHVWIGLQSVIVRGSKIGEGAVIAANSLVGGKIKAGTMASGNPARSYSEIKWSAN